MYDFGRPDENWFTHAPNLLNLIREYVGRPNVHFLELGSWKGRSAVWFMENVLTHPTSRLTCIDLWDVTNWDETEEKKLLFNNAQRMKELRVDELYQTFLSNIEPFRERVNIVRDRTDSGLKGRVKNGDLYDFIYVDADHSKEAVLKDVELSCLCLRSSGVILLDDASWPSVREAIDELVTSGLTIFNLGQNGAFLRYENIPKGWLKNVADKYSLAVNSELEPFATRFCSPKYTYLASADQFAGLENALQVDPPKIEKYFSVIGGMGGLNFLPRLDGIRDIVFFDINSYAVDIAKIYTKIIAIARDRFDFISLFYQRPFSSRYGQDNIDEYLALAMENDYRSRLIAALDKELYETYEHYYWPFITAKNFNDPIYESRTHHCTTLKIFHEAPVDAIMTWPFKAPDVLEANNTTSTNAFFFGKGWLESDSTFAAVKNILSRATIDYRVCGIDQLDLDKNCGVYTSNILRGDEDFFPDIVVRACWTIWFSPRTKFLHAEFISDQPEPNSPWIRDSSGTVTLLAGEGIRDTHKSCCEAMRKFFDPDRTVFLEIIAPPENEGLNYGFRFFGGQIPITVDQFLNENIEELTYYPVIVFHILLGCGTSIQKWKACLEKALAACSYIIVVEHRQACADWPEPDVDPDTLLPEQRIDELLAATGRLRGKCYVANRNGRVDDPRNIFWVLNRGESLRFLGAAPTACDSRMLVLGDFFSPVSLSENLITEEVKSLFEVHDVVSCNFEGTISQAVSQGKLYAGCSLVMPKQCVADLKRFGVTHLSCANNHIMDGGRPGLDDLLAEAASHGLSVSGVGRTKSECYSPYRKTIRGNRISLISLAEAEFGAFRDDVGYGFARATSVEARKLIEGEKLKGRLVIVQPHAGVEEIDIPLSNWRNVYRGYIDAGADIVIAHHPHVVQGAEAYKGKYIFYSLGNFMFPHSSMASNKRWNEGLGVSVAISKQQILGCNLVFTTYSGQSLSLDNSPERKGEFDQLTNLLRSDYAQQELSMCQKLYAERYRGYYRRAVSGEAPNLPEVALLLHNLRFESHRWAVEGALESVLRE